MKTLKKFLRIGIVTEICLFFIHFVLGVMYIITGKNYSIDIEDRFIDWLE